MSRTKIEPAINKLIAHADRDAIRKGKPLGLATWEEWSTFWATLRKFINALNQKALGAPYDIDVAGVPGDAAMLLKALNQSKYFETLLPTGDKPVKESCLKIAQAPAPQKS